MAVTVCRGGRRTIACPQLQLLHIFTAFYGKMSGQDCEEPMVSPRTQIPTCSSKQAGQLIRDECHGQQSCDLYADDSMYDNPCPEVLKYLFVSYTCQGKTDVLGKLRTMESTNVASKPVSRQAFSQPIMPQKELTPVGVLSGKASKNTLRLIYAPRLLHHGLFTIQIMTYTICLHFVLVLSAGQMPESDKYESISRF